MKKSLICMISLICLFGMAFPAACQSGPKTNAEGQLIASNGYRIPNVPEEPIFVGNFAMAGRTTTDRIGTAYVRKFFGSTEHGGDEPPGTLYDV